MFGAGAAISTEPERPPDTEPTPANCPHSACINSAGLRAFFACLAGRDAQSELQKRQSSARADNTELGAARGGTATQCSSLPEQRRAAARAGGLTGRPRQTPDRASLCPRAARRRADSRALNTAELNNATFFATILMVNVACGHGWRFHPI